MKRTPHKKLILDYIREFGSITPLEAIRDLGCYRLSARVHDLRKAGFNIVTTMIDVKNRYGGVSQIAKYTEEGEAS